jgi:effector-binding domain-containing protein
MKYARLVMTLLILSSVIGFYWLIPSTIKVSTFKVTGAHELSILRLINNQDLTFKSMSAFKDKSDNQIKIDDIHFSLNNVLSNLIQVDITTDKIKTKSFITVNSINRDSAAIHWFFEIKSGWNPINRWNDYQEAKKIKNATAQLLNEIKSFVEQPINVYGFDIKEISLKDTLLIVTKFKCDKRPTNAQIYTAADELSKYLNQFNLKAINNPMVTILDNQTYDYTVMVGLSIDSKIPETEKYTLKRMPVNGKMFVAEVTGGNTAIQNGYSALKNYLLDAKRPSPAVPFELLMNDRRQITDSAKWQTKLYYPVM